MSVRILSYQMGLVPLPFTAISTSIKFINSTVRVQGQALRNITIVASENILDSLVVNNTLSQQVFTANQTIVIPEHPSFTAQRLRFVFVESRLVIAVSASRASFL